MHQKSSITVECLGDPSYYDDYCDPEDPDYDADGQQPENCYGKRKIYTLEKLPSKTAIFIIKQLELSMELIYNFWSLTEEKLIEFVKALQSNGIKTLEFDPGSNSYAKIITSHGMTRFYLQSGGGNEPCEFSINVPNERCLAAFVCLLKGG